MSTTKIKFSPSINILRDSGYEFGYIATPNSIKVFQQVVNDTLVGIKSHIIIGAYGSGKSSLLLATMQALQGVKSHFKGFETLIKKLPKFEFLPIVGTYSSLSHKIAQFLGIEKTDYSANDLIKGLDKYHNRLKKSGKGLAILIDEFGKFLEYAAKHNPEAELYFIQQLAEWINNTNSQTLLITTLHQDFNAYSLSLNKSQQQEWQKVKGRLKEVVFNEPVEQLLFLAAERIHEKFKERSPEKGFDKLFGAIEDAKVFPLRDYFDKDFARKLYPFDILSASILTLALQKYGQNERSLFSFIESHDRDGINENKKGYYNIANVYDYLLNNFYSLLVSKYNPHYSQWSALRNTLERIEGLLSAELQKDASALVKTIGLLNTLASASAKLEPQFYYTYSKLALGISNPQEVIRHLEKHKVIRYVKHSFKYILFEGTDLDIELAIDEAGRIVEKATNVVDHLNQYFEFPFIPAKSAYYLTGTPRFFQFKLTEEPISLVPEDEIDGFINLVFNEDPSLEKKIIAHSKNTAEAILYGYYKNTANIQSAVYEIQKVKKVIVSHHDDKAAVKALKEIELHYIELLNHYVLDGLYSDPDSVVWYFQGKKQSIKGRDSFNQTLSKIIEEVYFATPILKNELLNKTKISSQIASARRNLIQKLLTNLTQENLGFEQTRFPPEKSIYLSLIKETGLHVNIGNSWTWGKPTDKSFDVLWETGEAFLNSTKSKERNLQELIDILSTKPLKLKQGFIDYWIPIFLLAKNDEYALYEGDIYIPQINDSVLELINKKPGLFKVKAFDVIEAKMDLFNRIRTFLNLDETPQATNKTFIQNVRPFLAFYRDLPEYSKKTNQLSKESIALRDAIANTKDPEKAIFEDFPTALGFSPTELLHKKISVEEFIEKLQNSIREIKTSYDRLLDQLENHLIKEVFGFNDTFPHYKLAIKDRYKYIKTHLLLNHQKSFYNRLLSQLDDRTAWLNSVAQACIGKPLVLINDQDEPVLHERLIDWVYELDNLCEISKANIDHKVEEVLKVEITSFVQGLNKNLVRIPKAQSKDVDAKVNQIRSLLGKDKKINVTILAKLLQEYLK
jgi:hypothetical protein